jgi:hypothetical protein
MVRKLVGALGLTAMAYAILGAADFWETKPFTMWTDQELQQVSTDSPWAKKIVIAAGGRAGGASDTPVVISWRSALPMKQALVRMQVGLGGALTPQARAMLDQRETGYVVSVDGLPARLAGSTANIWVDTSIKVDDKARVGPDEGLAQPSGNSLILGFMFPRAPIGPEDKTVEFVTKVGAFEIKGVFNLKEMVFHGRLEM